MPEADAALHALTSQKAELVAYQVAEFYAYRGECDQASAWLEKSREIHDAGLYITRLDPLLASLRNDPRWPEFLRKLGLADDQLK